MRVNPFLSILDKVPKSAKQIPIQDGWKVEVYNAAGWPIASRRFRHGEQKQIDEYISSYWR